jgi:hypothetical protein
MGYSKNPKTLSRIEGKLSALAAGQSCSWYIRNGTADQWAYKVREALSIAERFPLHFPALAAVASRVRVYVGTDARTVFAQVSDPMDPVERVQPVTPEREPLNSRGLTLISPTSVAQVVEFYLRSQPTSEPIRVEGVDFSEEQMLLLWKFAQSRTPAWILLQSMPGSFTIAPSTPDIPEGALWRPAEDDHDDSL